MYDGPETWARMRGVDEQRDYDGERQWYGA
jgi:hypothetical protein